MDLEVVRARLVGDASQFVTEFGRAEQAVGGRGGTTGLAGAASHSNRSLNLLRGGMVGLAAEATGTSGPVAKLAQGLLMFGGGSTLILGVAAGIGAIVLAYRALTKDSKDAEKATDDLMKKLDGVGIHAQLTVARFKLAQAQAGLDTDPSNRGFFGRILAIFETEGEETERAESAARKFATAQNEVATLTREVAKWQKDIADTAAAAARAHERSVMALEKMVGNAKLFKDTMETAIDKAKELQTGSKDRAAEEVRLGFLDRSGKSSTAKEMIEAAFKPTELERALNALGISLGQQFALSIATGIQSMGDLVKSVLLQILSFGISALLGSFGKLVTGGLSAAGGKVPAIKESVVAPASMSLSMAGMPAATNPLAAARDQMWQVFLRESIITAHSQGFRA